MTGGFWSAHSPEIKTRWQVIIAAGRVLLETACLGAGGHPIPP